MKDIIGYEGLYQASEDGHIWSIKDQVWLKERVNWDGYLKVTLHKDKKQKTIKIHRIIAETFIENPQELSDVDHINGDKINNGVGNLQWMSHRDNVRKSNCKRVVCVETGEIFYGMVDAAEWANTKRQYIYQCCKLGRPHAGGYRWKYYDNQPNES